MDSLESLKQSGISLGYEGQDLMDFIKEQQAIERDERNAQRQKEREKYEFELALKKNDLEREKLEHEKEKIEHEKGKIDHEVKLKQMLHVQQLELLHKQAEMKVGVESVPYAPPSHPRAPKIPAFEEHKDEMDSYLQRFERYANAQKWDPANWAINLSALLKGRALDVYALMPPDQANDYELLRSALLKRYDLTEDGFKRKFRNCRTEQGETFAQFAVRLGSYLNRWVDMSRIEKTYDGLYDLVLRDQFVHICNRELSLFLKERVSPETTGCVHLLIFALMLFI